MAARILRTRRFPPASIHIDVTRNIRPASRTVSRLNQVYLHTTTKNMDGSTKNTAGHDHQSTEGELNQWKFRAPYKIHENDPEFHVRYEGSCHCGKVKYQLSREKPLDSKYCHCTTCQKLHGEIKNLSSTFSTLVLTGISGAPFQWAAIFHKEDINFTHGHHDLGWYESSEKTCIHKLPCKVSCAYCRTPIMDEGRNMILLFPTLINFKTPEDRKNFDIRSALHMHEQCTAHRLLYFSKCSCHMFYPRRVVDILDGKPKWSGINNESDLIEDSPKEAKEDLKRKREEEKE